MEAVQSDWGYLEPWSYFRDADDVIWRVEARRSDLPRIALACTSATGEQRWIVGNVEDPVTMMVPTGAEAEAILRERLGAEVVIYRIEDLPTKNNANSRGMLRTHLWNEHNIGAGTEVQNPHIDGLLELHALAHSSPQPGWTPHVHVPRGSL